MASPKKKADAFQPSGDIRRVQSLGGGRWVRVGDHKGKWHHLSVEKNSDDLAILLSTVDEENPELARRIVGELAALNPEFARFGDHLSEVEA